MENNNKAIYGSSGDFLKFLREKSKDKKKTSNNKKELENKKNFNYNKNKFTS